MLLKEEGCSAGRRSLKQTIHQRFEFRADGQKDMKNKSLEGSVMERLVIRESFKGRSYSDPWLLPGDLHPERVSGVSFGVDSGVGSGSDII